MQRKASYSRGKPSWSVAAPRSKCEKLQRRKPRQRCRARLKQRASVGSKQPRQQLALVRKPLRSGAVRADPRLCAASLWLMPATRKLHCKTYSTAQTLHLMHGLTRLVAASPQALAAARRGHQHLPGLATATAVVLALLRQLGLLACRLWAPIAHTAKAKSRKSCWLLLTRTCRRLWRCLCLAQSLSLYLSGPRGLAASLLHTTPWCLRC